MVRELTSGEKRALARRHNAAMGLVGRMPLGERWQLLLAVVAPTSDVLNALDEIDALPERDEAPEGASSAHVLV